MNFHSPPARVDHDHRECSGAEPVLDLLLDLRVAVARRDNFYRNVRSAGKEPRSTSRRFSPLTPDECRVRGANVVGIGPQLESGFRDVDSA